VTVPGPYLRVLVVPVAGGESIGPISWSPYHPGPGQPVTFLVRLDQTDAKPEDGPANVTLCGDDGSAASRSLLVETETPGIWTASLTVPESDSRFGFRIQTTETDLCYTERFDDFWAPPSEIPRRLSNPDLTFVERTGNRLTLTFEQPVDPGNLGLGYAGSPDGPWSPSATGASVSPLGDHILNWELEPLPDSARYFRVSMLGNGNPRVLFTDVLGRTVPRAGLRSVGVRPNPSPHDVVWRLEIDQPTRVRFEVFDVQGRRVHGPQDLDLEAGRREIRWNGLRDTRTGSGVYFLSLSGGGSRSVVKLVLSP
jgi:hypothetical protein